MHLSRRLFVRSGTAVLAASAFALFQPPSTASATLEKTRAPAPCALEISTLGITSHVFNPDFTTASPFSEVFGCQISGPRSAISGATITVAFDARVSAFTDQEVVFSGLEKSTIVSLPVVGVPGSFTFVVPTVGEGSAEIVTQLALPLRKTLGYPNENIAPVEPTVITVTPLNGSAPMMLTASPVDAATTGLAWGVVAAPIWAEAMVNRAESSTYSYPAFLKLDSVGPGPIPVGTTLTISADAALVSSLTVESIFVDDDRVVLAESKATQALVDGMLVTTIVLVQPVAPFGSLTVELSAVARAAPARIDHISYCMVAVSPAGERSPLQRVTGSETVVPVSDSGVPRAHNPIRVKN